MIKDGIVVESISVTLLHQIDRHPRIHSSLVILKQSHQNGKKSIVFLNHILIFVFKEFFVWFSTSNIYLIFQHVFLSLLIVSHDSSDSLEIMMLHSVSNISGDNSGNRYSRASNCEYVTSEKNHRISSIFTTYSSSIEEAAVSQQQQESVNQALSSSVE